MSSRTRMKLDNQICFSLYSASLAMTQLYKPKLEPLGLTYPQYLVMLILWEQDGVELKYIGEKLGQKSGALTPVLKRLEDNGYLKRVKSPDSDRSLSIQLTDQGKALYESASEVNRCVADSCGIEAEELLTLQNTLSKLKNSLNQAS